MKVSADIHFPVRMNRNNFGWTFHLAPLLGQLVGGAGGHFGGAGISTLCETGGTHPVAIHQTGRSGQMLR